MKKVSIVILNYNGYIDTIECFESLEKITYSNYNIVIVDNASPDGAMNDILHYMNERKINNRYFQTFEQAIESEKQEFDVVLIQSGNNNGYGHGNNIGIKYALKQGTDYVLVLNNDTIVEPDFLEPMVQMCEKDKNIGIASGKIYFYDRQDTIWFNGGKFSPCTAKVEHFNFNEKDIGQVPTEPITFISGCMWLIPKRVFENVGFINEDYFMYVEDLEYSTRVLKAGYQLKIVTEGNVYHKVGGSTGGQFSSFSVFWRIRNMNKLIATYSDLFCKLKAYFLFNIKTIVQLILAKKTHLLKAYVKGLTASKKDYNVT